MGENNHVISGLLTIYNGLDSKEFMYDESSMNYAQDVAFLCLFSYKMKKYAEKNKLHRHYVFADDHIHGDRKYFCSAFSEYTFSPVQIITVLDELFHITRTETIHIVEEKWNKYDMFVDVDCIKCSLPYEYKYNRDRTKIKLCKLNNGINKTDIEIDYVTAIYILTRYFTDEFYRLLIERLIRGESYIITDVEGNKHSYQCLLNSVYRDFLRIFHIETYDLLKIDEKTKRVIIRDKHSYNNVSSLSIKYLLNNVKYELKEYPDKLVLRFNDLNFLKDKFINLIKDVYVLKNYKKTIKFMFSDIQSKDSIYFNREPKVENIKFSVHKTVSFDIIFNTVKEK